MRDWIRWDNKVIVGGKGFYLIDSTGRRYLDGIASMWCNVWGHSDNEILNKMSEQIQTIPHSTLFGLGNQPSIVLAEKMLRLCKGMQKVFYSDNGSTAIEVAMKMAVQYWHNKGKPRKRNFISLENAYHGDTLGAMSLGYLPKFFRPFKPLLAKVYKAPSPQAGIQPSCTDDNKDVSQTERIISKHKDTCAAFIMESGAQIAGGGIIYKQGYQKRISELCRQYDLLFILDEIATGFGRLGNMVEYLAQRSRPDIVCFGKALTGGYTPLAVTLTSADIYDSFLGSYAESRHLCHGHTFTGYPLGCAAGIANLQLFEKHKLIDRIRENAEYINRRLKELNSPIVANLRRKGLFAAFELQRKTKPIRLMRNNELVQYFVMRESMKMGVILRSLGNTMIVIPPLAIFRKDLRRLMDVQLLLVKRIERESK
jgi:adenosylmethionine-8-amino-7-oxononanoate aminotransferase